LALVKYSRDWVMVWFAVEVSVVILAEDYVRVGSG